MCGKTVKLALEVRCRSYTSLHVRFEARVNYPLTMWCWQSFVIWIGKIIEAESFVAIWKRRIIYNAPEKVRQIHKYCNNALVRWGEVSTSACHGLRFIQIFTEAGRANGVRPGYYTRLACLYRCIQVIKLYILNFRVIHLEIKTCRTEFWNWNTVSVLARSCGEVILSSLSLCLRPPFSIVRTILSSLLEYPLYAATPQDWEMLANSRLEVQ